MEKVDGSKVRTKLCMGNATHLARYTSKCALPSSKSSLLPILIFKAEFLAIRESNGQLDPSSMTDLESFSFSAVSHMHG
jgi:hypothetical protein